MKKYFKTGDGYLYLNVTAHANELWQSKSIELFVLWEKGNTTYRLPVMSEEELTFALNQDGKNICIEIGTAEELSGLFEQRIDKLSTADTITHNGFLYVRCNDIL
jgi:hypothetical protein